MGVCSYYAAGTVLRHCARSLTSLPVSVPPILWARGIIFPVLQRRSLGARAWCSLTQLITWESLTLRCPHCREIRENIRSPCGYSLYKLAFFLTSSGQELTSFLVTNWLSKPLGFKFKWETRGECCSVLRLSSHPTAKRNFLPRTQFAKEEPGH